MQKKLYAYIASALAVAILIVFATMVFGSSAQAGQKCNTGNNACAAFWKQMYESEKSRNQTSVTVTVRKKATTKKRTTTVSTGGGGTVCVYARVRSQKSTSAVVLYVGGYSARNSGKVLKTWGSGGWVEGQGGYYKKLCLDGSLIAGQNKVTICGIDGHNTWSSNDIAYLLRVGSIGKNDPADMFGGGRQF